MFCRTFIVFIFEIIWSTSPIAYHSFSYPISAKYSFKVNFGQCSKFYIFESKSPYSISGSNAVADSPVGQVLAGPLNVFLKVKTKFRFTESK